MSKQKERQPYWRGGICECPECAATVLERRDGTRYCAGCLLPIKAPKPKKEVSDE